jgi:fatty acid desaturase
MISRTSDPNDWTEHSQQRDESSELASSTLRIRPAELKEFYAVSSWRALGSLAATWSLIFLAVAAAIWSRSVPVWIVAAFIIGRSQHALAVLMHDAAHFRFLENRKWNDIAAQWLCAFPIASNLYAYRNVHLRHHRFLLTDRDPDLSLSRPYPVSWASFRRKLIRDATGVSALVMRGYLTVENGRSLLSRGNAMMRFTRANVGRRILAAGLIGALFATGYGEAFLLLWVVPLLTVYQVILRVRGVLEHGAIRDPNDGFKNARTIVSRNPMMRFFLNPHHVAYHLEHHLYPGVPHYYLPRLHRALAADSRFSDAMVERTYTQAYRDLIKPDAA